MSDDTGKSIGWAIGLAIAGAIAIAGAVGGTIIAREYVRRYINRMIKERMAIGILIIVLQLTALIGCFIVQVAYPGKITYGLSILVMWSITLFNLFRFFFGTLPGLHKLHKDMRGYKGYVIKHVLQISLVKEMIEGNLIILFIVLMLSMLARMFLGAQYFTYGLW